MFVISSINYSFKITSDGWEWFSVDTKLKVSKKRCQTDISLKKEFIWNWESAKINIIATSCKNLFLRKRKRSAKMKKREREEMSRKMMMTFSENKYLPLHFLLLQKTKIQSFPIKFYSGSCLIGSLWDIDKLILITNW